GLAGSVRLLGFCDNPYAPMSRASAFVLTSDFEGLPNALIEAQGLGLPAVSTYREGVSGSGEVIEDGRTGFLGGVGDADALADRRERRRLDRGLGAEMGAAAGERARRVFDLRAIVSEWEDLLCPPAGAATEQLREAMR